MYTLNGMQLRRDSLAFLCLIALLSSCNARQTQAPPRLTVAAPANLNEDFGHVCPAFKAKTGVEVVFSYGSTAELAQQIENGAPFDLFAAADREHIDSLVTKGNLAANSRAVYAMGELAMWVPGDEQHAVRDLKDL